MTITMAKEDRLNIRVSSKVKVLLEAAAESRQQTVTEFVLESALASASDAILDRNLFVLPPEDFNDLVESLSDPEANLKLLERLESKAKKWQG